MKATISFVMVLAVVASLLMGCIGSNGPTQPSANEIDGYKQGWSQGKDIGYIAGYIAYCEGHNITIAGINTTIESIPEVEKLPGFPLGESQGKAAAWGYGYYSAMAENEPVEWEKLGYIKPENQSADAFYKGLGYDISKYKSMGLTDILKEGTEQCKATNSISVTGNEFVNTLKVTDGFISSDGYIAPTLKEVKSNENRN